MLRRSLPSLFALFSTAFALPDAALAQLSGDQAVAAADATKSNLPPDTFGGEMTFGAIGDDFFLTLALGLNFNQDMWGFGLQVPVRLRVYDAEPKADDFFLGLRREDWDEVSDFFRMLRYVYVGQADKKGLFYVRAGELSNLTLGHGTIMRRYYNGIDASRWHPGLNAAVNIHAFGAEAVLGDVTDPYVAGLRFTVRPLQLAMGEGFWEKLVVGATLMTDSKAPFEIKTRLSDPMNPMSALIADTDDKNAPIVARERTLAVFGADVGLEVVDTEILKITPYIDFNKMNVVKSGWGLHMGVLWNVALPVAIDSLIFDLRTEYRRVAGDYVGPYFDTAYEIERYQLLADDGGLPLPKLRALCNADPTQLDCTGQGSGRNGVFFDLLAGFPQFVFVGGEFTDYDGGQADGTLRLSLEVPALEVVKFSAFYYRINIAGLDDLFAIDDRSAIVAQAAIPLYSVFSLNLRWWRVWQADQEGGGYKSVDDWSVGVSFALEI